MKRLIYQVKEFFEDADPLALTVALASGITTGLFMWFLLHQHC